MAGPMGVSSDYEGEKTLLTAKPTRYIAFRYYVTLILALILAPLIYFRPWYFDRIPEVTYGPVSTTQIIVGLLLLLGLYALLRAELMRATTHYTITDNKIIRVDGILNKNTQMVPYTQLERVDLRQSFVQRILRIGTVIVDTGDDTLEIEMVPHPARIQELLSQRLGRRSYVQQQR